MSTFLLLAAGINATWYLIPLAAVVSLVYSASRYEMTEQIVNRSIRLFLTIMIFMGVVLTVLLLLSYYL